MEQGLRGVSVLADRRTRTRCHPETWPALARGCKSNGVRISALAQGDQAPALCSLQCRHYSVRWKYRNCASCRCVVTFVRSIRAVAEVCMCIRVRAYFHRHTCAHTETHTHPSPSDIARGGERIRKHSQVCPLWPVAVGRRGCLSPLISPVPQEAHLHAATDPSVPHG